MVREYVIVPYDVAWPQTFRTEAGLLLALFEPGGVRIEHIGSTAVPGLGAKPIIDIMLGAPRLVDIEQLIPSIESLGYEYVPEYEAEMPDRRYFRKDTDGRRSHHLHGVELGGVFWRDHLLFRDYLRSHSEVAEEYYQLKLGLSERFRTDGHAYTHGKDSFIAAALASARLESEQPQPNKR
jgi:GrpB-like predicted nucleotidyltransferase (UPF0157 family)